MHQLTNCTGAVRPARILELSEAAGRTVIQLISACAPATAMCVPKVFKKWKGLLLKNRLHFPPKFKLDEAANDTTICKLLGRPRSCSISDISSAQTYPVSSHPTKGEVDCKVHKCTSCRQKTTAVACLLGASTTILLKPPPIQAKA